MRVNTGTFTTTVCVVRILLVSGMVVVKVFVIVFVIVSVVLYAVVEYFCWVYV